MLSLFIAAAAGVVTIAAPCTLPVLPILFGTSLGRSNSARPLFIALGFILSFTFVALALGAVTTAFDFDANILREGAAIVLLTFGLLMIWPRLYQSLTMWLRGLTPSMPSLNFASADRSGNLGGFFVGTALGLVWTPCAGPVLGAILTLVATSSDASWAALQLVAYAVGAAVPLLLIAYGGQALTSRARRLAPYAPRLQQGFGVVVVAFAVATYLQYDTTFVAWLTQHYPSGLTLL